MLKHKRVEEKKIEKIMKIKKRKKKMINLFMRDLFI